MIRSCVSSLIRISAKSVTRCVVRCITHSSNISAYYLPIIPSLKCSYIVDMSIISFWYCLLLDDFTHTSPSGLPHGHSGSAIVPMRMNQSWRLWGMDHTNLGDVYRTVYFNVSGISEWTIVWYRSMYNRVFLTCFKNVSVTISKALM